jgi:hypothetical protein
LQSNPNILHSLELYTSAKMPLKIRSLSLKGGGTVKAGKIDLEGEAVVWKRLVGCELHIQNNSGHPKITRSHLPFYFLKGRGFQKTRTSHRLTLFMNWRWCSA